MKHVAKHFQAWSEGQLDGEAQRLIGIHLEECAECRMYFERMSSLLEKSTADDIRRLEPDPFLPGRIRALAEGSPATAPRALIRPLGWLRLSYYAILFAAAVTGGVYVGQSAAGWSSGNGDDQLLTGYYEAFSQSGFADEWEQLVTVENKEL